MASRSAIDRSGQLLREWVEDPQLTIPENLDEALTSVYEYRRLFSYPLAKVSANLRFHVGQESAQIQVGQRLKRIPQIVNKLRRYPSTRLSQLEDIGGTRAVLADRAELAAVRGRIERNWVVVRERDYIARPKATGYRAVHLVVNRDDRLIEVQLRTQRQQVWADAVELLSARYGAELKDGDGPEELRVWLLSMARSIEAHETGGTMKPAEFVTLVQSAEEARVWMEGRSR